jgi:hypothetical protein
MADKQEQDGEHGAPNALGMSDEDFLKLDPSEFAGPAPDDQDDPDNDDGKKTPEEIEEERRAALSQEERDAEDAAAAADDDLSEEEKEEQRRAALSQEERDEEDRRAALTDDERAAEDAAAADKGGDDDGADPDKDKKPDKKKPASGELTDEQYVDIGKQVMAEFKANGKTIKIKSAEDAIQLMQMGANYHKKMAGLKPSLKTLKLLENHDLLDPSKLNYLIDLSQKKPEAITKLLKEADIDPMNIDLKGDDDYVPDNRTVNEKELLLDEVLEDIKGNESYGRTLTVVGEDWDDTSRSVISDNPQLLGTINSHMESGVFDQVAEAVAYERSLGRLTGVSDLEAYQRIGTHMHENKLFKNATKDTDLDTDLDDQRRDGNELEETEEEKKQRRDRKKAVSPTRQKKSPAEKKEKYNPLEMSDEDFIKLNKVDL